MIRPADPLALALAAAIREIAARRASERLARRANMRVVDDPKRGGQAA